MVICLERGADLHMAQLMPLPLAVSCFSKIQIGRLVLPFWYRPTRVVLEKGPLNGCVCVCVCGAQQHYTVRSLSVMADCTCNGHDVDCRPTNSTDSTVDGGGGSYECVCGGNTTGRFCEHCLPLYNQQPFRYAAPCQGKCLCFCVMCRCLFLNSFSLFLYF